MKSVFKTIYYFCFGYILLIFLVALLIRITPLDFATPAYGDLFDILFFGGIPAAILLTMTRIGFRTLDKTQKRTAIITSFLLSFGCFFLFFLYALGSLGSGMCDYSNGRTLFTNRTDPSIRIIIRYYGCGAVDSSPATPSIAKLKPFTPVFNYVSPVDTSKINKEDWIRVNDNQ